LNFASVLFTKCQFVLNYKHNYEKWDARTKHARANA